MKKKVITMILMAGLVLSQTTSFSFAEVQPSVGDNIIGVPTETIEQNGDAEVQAIQGYSAIFKRESNTLGKGWISVSTNTVPTSIKATIRLQVADKGSTSYKNASASPVTATVKNKITLMKHFSFPITTSKNYRVKVTVVETLNGNTSSKTYYAKLS